MEPPKTKENPPDVRRKHSRASSSHLAPSFARLQKLSFVSLRTSLPQQAGPKQVRSTKPETQRPKAQHPELITRRQH